MLKDFFVQILIQIEELNIGNIWFQKDGTTCHTAAEATLYVLRPAFENRILSCRVVVI